MIGNDGTDLETLRNDYSWRSVKAFIYSSEEVISFAEIFELVKVTNNKIFLTPASKKFKEFGKSDQYELTSEQLDFLRFQVLNHTRTSRCIDNIISGFRYNHTTNRYEHSVKDEGEISAQVEAIFLLRCLGIIKGESDGVSYIDPRLNGIVGMKMRTLRSLEAGDLTVSPELLILSKHAEKLVLDFEKERLRNIGRSDLSEKVKNVAETDIRVGYDILSFDGLKSEPFFPDRFIEVKASKSNNLSFFWSQNEFRKAQNQRGNYWIYFLGNVKAKCKIDECCFHTFSDPIKSIILDRPSTYIQFDKLHILS
ncbi:MAG: DUF3883 domain-containing protein [Nitrososphaerota archaeon]|nr:DUF3883 domain-containing protein [Nitrososphaerota archaeon]